MKTPSSRKLFQGLAIALVGLSMWAGLNPAVAEVTPHQAVYKLTLSSKSPTSRFAGLSGAAVSQIDRTCEGWVINEQVMMSMETIAGGLINREMTFKAKRKLGRKIVLFR